MDADFHARLRKLRLLMQRSGLQACLINSRSDVYYYTGKDIGDSCFLMVPSGGKPTLFVTSLSNEIQSSSHFSAVFMKGLSDISKRLKPYKRVGFDEYSTNFWAFSQIKKAGCGLKPSASLIKEPRMVKDEYELEEIKKASEIARRTVSGLGDISGKSELQVAESINSSFQNMGSKPSFETIVSSGKHSAFVHHTPDKNTIAGKDLVIVDLGAMHNGYCSDMTRTLCASPGQKEKRLMEDISQIQSELIDISVPGAKYEDIQRRFELLLKKKHYKVMHSFGHGIGIAVHERPSKGDILKEGMVITVEPGAYVKGFGGCRIEDMILVRKGKPQILTR